MFRDAKRNFGKLGVFTTYPELNSILRKVRLLTTETIDNWIYSPESYKFSPVLHSERPSIKNKLSNGHLYDLTSNIFEKLKNEVFFDSCPQDGQEYMQIYGKKDNERQYMYILKRYIQPHDNLDFYKIFLPKANGSGAIGEVLSTPVIGQPVIGHTQTFISIGALNTLNEAEALLKYIKTKFLRTLLGILKVTQDNKKAVWKFVPLQNFTGSSDIDWSKSVAEIDQQLYAKYNLTDEEISFIESMIKPME